MLRKINQIDHRYLPLMNGVRLLGRVEEKGRTNASSALYSAETIAALRPAVPTQSSFIAQRLLQQEKRAMITERLWLKYGTASS